MTNRLLPVKASMKPATSPLTGKAPQGERGELEPGDPALGALIERVHVVGREVQPHHSVEELPRLRRREAQVGGAHLRELSATAEPGQRQGWVGAGGDDEAQVIGKMVEQEGHRLVHLGRVDGVVVVEHEEPPRLRSTLPGASDVVDQRGQGDLGRGGVHGLEHGGVDVEVDAPEGGHEVGEEPHQVVVAVVEGEPRDADGAPVLIELGEPVAEQGGLAETCRCGHEREPVARLEGRVELLGEPGPRDELRAPGGREQLRGENRSRHHPRIIGNRPADGWRSTFSQGGPRHPAG